MNILTYRCDHICYSFCTLYTDGTKGIAVIIQKFDPETKCTWWSGLDDKLATDICNNERFEEFWTGHSKEPVNGIYPTFTVRQVMRRIGMKPLEKQKWETRF